MTCLPCEYDAPERSPQTVEGWACWRAAEASLRGGMVQPHVDLSDALVVAEASGVARDVAAHLVTAVQNGMAVGLDKRRGK